METGQMSILTYKTLNKSCIQKETSGGKFN